MKWGVGQGEGLAVVPNGGTLFSVEYKTFISAAKRLKLLPWVDIDLGYVENVEKKMF